MSSGEVFRQTPDPVLGQMRDEIDSVDRRILDEMHELDYVSERLEREKLAGELYASMISRFGITEKVGRYKCSQGIDVRDNGRFQNVVNRVFLYSLDQGYSYSKGDIKRRWTWIHEVSVHQQERLIREHTESQGLHQLVNALTMTRIIA